MRSSGIRGVVDGCGQQSYSPLESTLHVDASQTRCIASQTSHCVLCGQEPTIERVLQARDDRPRLRCSYAAFFNSAHGIALTRITHQFLWFSNATHVNMRKPIESTSSHRQLPRAPC